MYLQLWLSISAHTRNEDPKSLKAAKHEPQIKRTLLTVSVEQDFNHKLSEGTRKNPPIQAPHPQHRRLGEKTRIVLMALIDQLFGIASALSQEELAQRPAKIRYFGVRGQVKRALECARFAVWWPDGRWVCMHFVVYLILASPHAVVLQTPAMSEVVPVRVLPCFGNRYL